MNPLAFHDALTSAKLLLVLGASPFALARKEVRTSTSRIRSGIDLALVGLALHSSDFPEESKLLQAYLASVTKHLVNILSKLHPDAFVLGRSHSSKLFRAGVSNITSALGAQRFVLDLLKGIEALTPQLSVPKVQPMLTAAANNPNRRATLRDFGSLVRNAEWLSMLAAVDVDPTSAEAQKQVEHLTATLGSRVGKTQVAQRTARFLGTPASAVAAAPARKSARTVKVTAHPVEPSAKVVPADRPALSEVAVIVVKLNPALLVSHPRVRELSVDFPETSPRVPDLLSAAAYPVEVKNIADATGIAQGKLDEFFAGLDRREVALAVARKSAAKAAENAQKERAMTALKGMHPDVLAVLKRNPGLLSKV